jgi:hypothetical protein
MTTHRSVSIQNYFEQARDQLELEGTAEPYGYHVQRNKIIIKIESHATKIELDIDAAGECIGESESCAKPLRK